MKTRIFVSPYTALCALASFALAACSLPPSSQVPAPVMDPAPGTYVGSETKIRLSCDNPDAVIFYTTNGAQPSESSMVYRNDITIKGDATIEAMAYLPGMDNSEVAEGTYIGGFVSLSAPFTSGGPLGIVLASDSRIYVTDSGGWIWRMDDISGMNLQSFSTGFTLGGIAVDSAGMVYFTDSNEVTRIDAIPPIETFSYGIFGMGVPDPGCFNNPSGVAVSNGSIYVADTGNNRIVCFSDTMDNTGWASFGTEGSGTNQFESPMGIAVGPDNKIYVADTFNNRIVRFDDMSGTSTNNWVSLGDPGSPITGIGFFNHPRGIAVSSKNKIYVADTMNNRIVSFENMNISNWKEFQNDITNPITQPCGIAVDASGFVYVADTAMSRILRYFWP